MRLLLVEDENFIAEPLKNALEKKGFSVDWEDDGKKALESCKIYNYDCILLDLNVPSLDGIQISSELKRLGNNTPIIMLTARSQQYNKIEGFNAGADDYVTKPFNFEELVLRINAIIRRSSLDSSILLRYKNIELDINSRTLKLDGKLVELNNKEFGLIEYFLRNKGKVISAEELLEHVWDREVDLFTQTLKTTIKTLRQKIDPEKTIIKNIRGAGYKINFD